MKILIGTQNPAKHSRLKSIIELAGFESLTFHDMPGKVCPDVQEAQQDLLSNAKHKALSYAQYFGQICLATDEGLWVEKYTEAENQILSLEPRRLGLGKRATDQEVIDWHNERLRRVGGSSLAYFTGALAIGFPQGGVVAQSFLYKRLLLMERGNNFPPICEGYPLDSQLKSLKFDKFIVELTPEELLQDMPLLAAAQFLRSSVATKEFLDD